MDLLAGDIKTLEEQTHSTWTDFRRLMSFGGIDPKPTSDDFGILKHSRAEYRKMIEKGEDPEQFLKRQLRPKFQELQAFLDRPLSLSMDRSPFEQRAIGLLKAIAVGLPPGHILLAVAAALVVGCFYRLMKHFLWPFLFLRLAALRWRGHVCWPLRVPQPSCPLQSPLRSCPLQQRWEVLRQEFSCLRCFSPIHRCLVGLRLRKVLFVPYKSSDLCRREAP